MYRHNSDFNICLIVPAYFICAYLPKSEHFPNVNVFVTIYLIQVFLLHNFVLFDTSFISNYVDILDLFHFTGKGMGGIAQNLKFAIC